MLHHKHVTFAKKCLRANWDLQCFLYSEDGKWKLHWTFISQNRDKADSIQSNHNMWPPLAAQETEIGHIAMHWLNPLSTLRWGLLLLLPTGHLLLLLPRKRTGGGGALSLGVLRGNLQLSGRHISVHRHLLSPILILSVLLRRYNVLDGFFFRKENCTFSEFFLAAPSTALSLYDCSVKFLTNYLYDKTDF